MFGASSELASVMEFGFNCVVLTGQIRVSEARAEDQLGRSERLRSLRLLRREHSRTDVLQLLSARPDRPVTRHNHNNNNDNNLPLNNN